MLKEIDMNLFENEVKQISKPVVLKFTADWCSGCRQLAPIVEKVEEELSEQIRFFDVNVDKAMDLAEKFGVMSLPTLVLLDRSEELKRVTAPEPNEETIRDFANILPN